MLLDVDSTQLQMNGMVEIQLKIQQTSNAVIRPSSSGRIVLCGQTRLNRVQLISVDLSLLPFLVSQVRPCSYIWQSPYSARFEQPGSVLPNARMTMF